MSRKYMNDRWCVRCSREDPTPYLVKKIDLLKRGETWAEEVVMDIGCGNGRNSNYLMEQGFHNISGYDMAGDVGEKLVLGKEAFPTGMSTVNIILANYVLMFLDTWEIAYTMGEIDRVARDDCLLMVELYPAKDSNYPGAEEIAGLQKELISLMKRKDWGVEHEVKERFIMRKESYGYYQGVS